MPPGLMKPAFANKPTAGPAAPAFGSDGSDRVFARLATMLRASTELHGCTVLAWDDPTVDQTPPGTTGPPWIRITPSPGASKIHSRGRLGVVHRMPITVAVETSVPSTDINQSQRLWGAILRAVFAGPTLDAQLAAAGVSRVEVTKPGWGPPRAATADQPEGGKRFEGFGSLELLMYFVTPE